MSIGTEIRWNEYKHIGIDTDRAATYTTSVTVAIHRNHMGLSRIRFRDKRHFRSIIAKKKFPTVYLNASAEGVPLGIL